MTDEDYIKMCKVRIDDLMDKHNSKSNEWIMDTCAIALNSLDIQAKSIEDMQKEMDELKNPWVSVDDRLPVQYETVICMNERGEIYEDYHEEADIMTSDCEWGSDVTPVRWMAVPEVKK